MQGGLRPDTRRPRIAHCDEHVGVRIQQLRLQCGFSQRQLAFPGCSYAYISRIEAGTRIPSLQTIRQLAARLETNESWLCWGESDPLEQWKQRALTAEKQLKAAREKIRELERRNAEAAEPALAAAAA